MARYSKEIFLGISTEEVDKIIEIFLAENNFYRTNWKGELCFTSDVASVREIRFLKYTYLDGVLHLEAWLRDGRTQEQGLTGLVAMDLKKPYSEKINHLINCLIDESPHAKEHKDEIIGAEHKQSNVYKIMWPIVYGLVILFILLAQLF